MRLTELRLCFNGLFVCGYGELVLVLRRIQNSELERRLAECRVEIRRPLQQFFDSLRYAGIASAAVPLPQTQSVVIIGERVLWFGGGEARQLRFNARKRLGRGLVHLPEKEIWSTVRRLEIRSCTDPLGSLAIRATGVERSAEPGQHSLGSGKFSGALRQNVHRRLYCPVEQQFRSPIKIILLAGIELRGLFILPSCFERVAQLFINVAQQIVKIRSVLFGKQFLDVLAFSD